MGANVESKIIVNIKALVDGTGQVKALSDATLGLEGSLGKTGKEMAQLTIEGTKLDGKFGKLQVSSKGFAFSLDGLGKKITGEFAPLGAVVRKIDAYIAAEKELERAIKHRQAVAHRDQFFADGQDPFAQGAKQHGTTPIGQAGKDINAAALGSTAAADIKNMEAQRAGLRKLNDEAVRSGREGAVNIRHIQNSIKSLDETRKFESLVGGLRNVERGFIHSAAGARILSAAASPITGIGRALTGVFAQLTRQLEFALAAMVLFVLASPGAVFGLLIKEGLEFNSVMEQQNIGLAALIQSTNTLFRKDQPNKPLQGIQAYDAASILAKASTDRLSVKLIPLRATIEDLLPIFNQIVTAGASAGLTLEQTENVFVDLAAAAQVVNIPLEKLATGIRLLLNGTARATTVLATALFGSATAANAWVKEHKKIGDLSTAIHLKLEAFRLALIRSETSLAVLGQNTKDVFQRLAGIATSGLFEKLKSGLVLVLQSFYDLQNLKIKPEFEDLFGFLNTQLTRFGAYLVSLMQRAIAFLLQIAKYVQDNHKYLELVLNDLIAIGGQLGSIVGDLFTVVDQTDEARGKTASWHEILVFVGAVIAAIRDEIKIVIGFFQVLAGIIAIAILTPLEAVAVVLSVISDRAAEAAVALHNANAAAAQYIKNGAFTLAEGATFRDVGQSITDANARDNPDSGLTFRKFVAGRKKGNQGANTADDFTNTLNKTAPNADKGAAAAADKLAHKLTELRRRTAELLRQLFDSQTDIERAGEQSEFNLLKDATARAEQEVERSYKQRLTSTHDYFVEKNAIELSAIEQERQHLKDQFAFDEKDFESKRQSIIAKTNEAVIDPKNKDVVVQEELEKHANIQIQELRNALKVKEVKLGEDLLLLDGKREQVQLENNQAEQDALDAFEKKARDVTTALTGITDPLSAEIRQIAEQNADAIKETLINAQDSTPALVGVIEQIRVLGSVTSSELIDLLNKAGVKFDDMDVRVQNLIAKMKQAEGQATFNQGQTDVGLLQGGLNLSRDAIQDKVNRGVITEAQGRRQIAIAETEVRIQIEAALAAMEKIIGLTPAQKQAIAGLKQEAGQLGREFDTVGNAINGVVGGELSNFFDIMLEGSANAKDAFLNMISSMLIGIAKAIFQATVLKTILHALKLDQTGTAGPGSAGGFGGILSTIIGSLFGGGGKKASGGPIDGPGSGTSDSVPFWGSNGEWVIPANRVAQYGRGLMASLTAGTFGRNFGRMVAGGPVGPAGKDGGGFTSLRNINVLDPNLLGDYMATSSGEKVFLNFITKNPNKVKAALGI